MAALVQDDVADQVRGVRLAGALAVGTAVVGSALELGPLCPLRRLTGIPCPLCGLTTGVAEVAQADLAGAVAAHPLALLAVAVLLAAWSPWGPAVIRSLRRHPGPIAVGLAVLWVGRLAGGY